MFFIMIDYRKIMVGINFCITMSWKMFSASHYTIILHAFPISNSATGNPLR